MLSNYAALALFKLPAVLYTKVLPLSKSKGTRGPSSEAYDV